MLTNKTKYITTQILLTGSNQETLCEFPEIELSDDQFWEWVDNEINFINNQIKAKVK